MPYVNGVWVEETPRLNPQLGFQSVPQGQTYAPPSFSGMATRNEMTEVPAAPARQAVVGEGNPTPGIAPVSGLLSLGLGIKQLYDANNVELNDTVPQELRDNAADARMRAASTKLPNQTQINENINQNATLATNAAMASATSPDQVLQAAGDIQSRSNNAMQQASGQGAMFQQGNIDKSRGYNMDLGRISRQDRVDKAMKEAMLTEAGWRNIGGFAGAADQSINAFM
jgi:hypothetical protein